MLRSTVSIVTAIAVWGALWVTANLVLATILPSRFDASGVTTEPALLVLFIVLCGVLCVLAGWLCATIASHSLMRHVSILGLIQLAIGIVAQASVWELLPIWYHVTFLAIVVRMHLVGGTIRVRRNRAGSALKETLSVAT